jgi:O-antigen/teichoic acid export membrane protein
MIKSILINNLSQSLQFGSRWILNIVLLRNMSISEFGIFSFLYSISNILSAILPFGSSIYIFKENDETGNKNLVIDSFVIIFISFFTTLLLYFIIFIFDINIRGFEYILYPIILGLFLSLNIILASYLKSLEQFIKELKAYFLFFILLVSFVFYIFIQKNINISQVFQVLIFINLITMIVFIKISSINLRILEFKQSIINIKILYKNRLYYGLQEIQTAIYGQSSMIILFYLLTTELYGVYRSLFILIMPISLISYSMTQVFINYLKKDIENIKIRFRKISLFSVIISVIFIFIFLILKEYLLELIHLKIEYSVLLIYLTILIFLQLINSSYSALLIVLNKQKIRFYGTLVSSIMVISLMLILVKNTNIDIAILINLFATIILSSTYVIYTERYLKKGCTK